MEIVKTDLTVIGGGIAGICCAVTAARKGLTVALVNDRPVLGGNASSEVCVGISGASYDGRSPSVYAREGGIIEELKLRLKHFNGGRNHIDRAIYDSVYLDMVYHEANISLFLNTIAYDAHCDGGKITAVDGMQLSSERQFTFISPIYADCSGDGTVAYKAGAEYLYGREAKSQFNESLAPDQADDFTLGDTILFHSKDTGSPVEYVKPDFAHDFKSMPFFKNINKSGMHRVIYRSGKEIHGHWWIEFGGQLNTIHDNEDISLELRKLVYGFWDYIKNGGDYEDVENLALTHLCPIAGKRESRRFIGKHILTQNDIADKTDFSDAVACGGWPMDIHAPRGIYDDAPATEWNYVPGSYNIPFRSLYSANVGNLLLAGRNISASHAAFGSTRVMATGGCMGQAIGTASFLCRKHGVLPDELYQSWIAELQAELVKDDQTIIGLPDQSSFEAMKTASVRASSEMPYRNTGADCTISLKESYCLALPLLSDRIDSVELFVKNQSAEQQTLVVDILGGTRRENYIPEYHVKQTSVRMDAGFDGWIRVEVDCDTPPCGKIYLKLEVNSALEVYCAQSQLTGVETFLFNSEDLRAQVEELPEYQCANQHICFRNVLPEQGMYGAENVLNPYSRPYGMPNLWISDGNGGNEYLELIWDKPQYVGEARIIFNTNLKKDPPSMPIIQIVTDYVMEYTGKDGVIYREEVSGNYLRQNILKIEKEITSLKYKMKITGGSSCFEVFSVKLYG